MRAEYKRADLGKGVRGANLVLLDPDVAAAFPDEDSVNNALRGLLNLAKTSVVPPKRRRRTRQAVQGWRVGEDERRACSIS